MVYAKSALTKLFGMLCLLSLCIGSFEKAFLDSKTKIQISCRPALGRPKAEWRWKAFFGKTSNFDSEARNRFQYTKIEREVKNNNVYHCPGLEFQYNQLSLRTKLSKYANMQRSVEKIWTVEFSHTLTASFRGSIDYIENQVLDNDKHCYSLLLSQFRCIETYFLFQNRDLKFCQKAIFSASRP